MERALPSGNPPPAAEPGPRAAAALFDAALAAVAVSVLQLALLLGGSGLHESGVLAEGLRAWSYCLATVSAPVWLILLATEGRTGRSPGKRLLDLAVVREIDGSRPRFRRLLLRTTVKLLPWEATLAVACLPQPIWVEGVDAVGRRGFHLTTLMVGFWAATVLLHPAHRGPHDLAAGTRVTPATQSSAEAGDPPGREGTKRRVASPSNDQK